MRGVGRGARGSRVDVRRTRIPWPALVRSHLSRDERLLALDGALGAARETHLARCSACRTEVDGLRGVLARVRAVDLPEPSPLFWDFLATRVGEAIAREPVPVATRGWWSPRLGCTAIALFVSAAAAGFLTRGAPTAAAVAQAPHAYTPHASTGTQAQRAPGLDEGRYGPFATGLPAVQQMRRPHLHQRAVLVRELQRLLRTSGTDVQLQATIEALVRLDATSQRDESRARDAVDAMLDVRQRARTRRD